MKKPLSALIVVFLFACQPKNSELLDCWVNSYESEFNFLDKLDEFEEELITKNVIGNWSGEEFREKFSLIEQGDLDLDFSRVTVDKYVHEEPFVQCASLSNLPNEDDRTLKYGILFSIYHILSKENARINLGVNRSGQIQLNNQAIKDIDELKLKLNNLISEKQEQGIDRENIIVAISVHKEAKMGLISNIQLTLRDNDLRNIEYNSYAP